MNARASHNLSPIALIPGPSPLGGRGERTGFTLIELLVTVTIIAILATLTIGALQSARETAREARTKATITKLHSIAMERYESYKYRRVPIDTATMQPGAAAVARLLAIRDLMRMEMPERLSDVTNAPISGIPRPGLSQAYLARGTPSAAESTAEMLYMWVTMSNPENREQFSESEIGDTDGDGFPEFIDGWGRPIYFLRWAPGLTDSDIQSRDPVNDHDPFDPRRVDPNAFRLVPLVYSAGSDGRYGIQYDPTSGAYTWNNDTYFQTFGAPLSGSDGAYSYDNIHNHHIEAR